MASSDSDGQSMRKAAAQVPAFEVTDGVAEAALPDSPEGLALLGERLADDGFSEVEIDGEEWTIQHWGLSPSSPLDHPYVEEVASTIDGSAGMPLDRTYSIHRIGEYWFVWDEFDVAELGRHDHLASAVAECEELEFSPTGILRLARPGDELIGLLDELGIEADDPDDYEYLSSIGVPLLGAVARCDVLMDRGGLYDALELVREHRLEVDEVEALSRRGDRLPIGDERLEDTVRWSRRDAGRRGIGFAEALEQRIAVGEQWDDWQATYDQTIAEVRLESAWEPATDEAARRGEALAVITASNPMSQPLDGETNRRRNLELRSELEEPIDARGRSVDGQWEEQSFAVPFDDQVIELAHSWGQAAIFRVTADAVEVVRLVGANAPPR